MLIFTITVHWYVMFVQFDAYVPTFGETVSMFRVEESVVYHLYGVTTQTSSALCRYFPVPQELANLKQGIASECVNQKACRRPQASLANFECNSRHCNFPSLRVIV
jgi:hypothetical protein